MSELGSRQLVASVVAPAGAETDPRIEAMVILLRQRHGEAIAAILLYGSYLRGQDDAMLDFYVLLDDYSAALPTRWQAAGNWLLPPNVYHLRAGDGDPSAVAKYATIRLDHFRRAIERDFHSYFWARFAQPCRIIFVRDERIRSEVIDGLHAATARFVDLVLPILPERFDASTLWISGLRRTYDCELRAERGNRPQELFAARESYYSALTAMLLAERLPSIVDLGDGQYRLALPWQHRRLARLGWMIRSVQGKMLSVARLMKGALTFHDPLDYVLWKIQRHSGIAAEPTRLQRRFPLIFGWSLLWRIRRRGGFR